MMDVFIRRNMPVGAMASDKADWNGDRLILAVPLCQDIISLLGEIDFFDMPLTQALY